MPTGQASLMPALRRVVLAGASTDRSDGQLLAAFIADRDADSFGLLVRRHGPMVLGVCRRVIGDHTTAEDAFQAAFLVLARRAPSVKPREQVGNWLYGVAYRTALKARAVLARRRSREKQVDVMPEPVARNSGGTTSAGSPDWSDLQPVIDEELARLPEKLRGPVVLCDIEGRPQREVAKHLGVPPATLATRLATARRTLAQRLTKRGVTLSGGAVAGLLTAHGTASAVPHTITHGLTRAAEALATGEAVSSLVSASAVQLSEGVMRMMLLTKLKAIAVVALTALTLTGGIGLGLVPARAGGVGDDTPAPTVIATPAPGQATEPAQAKSIDKETAKKWKEARINLNEPVDDLTFLRRLTLDVRGDMPTDIEAFFFVADKDELKRAKIVDWMLGDNGVQRTYAAKLLGVPAEQVRMVQMIDGKDGARRLVIVVDASAQSRRVEALAFTPDGKQLAVEVHDRRVEAEGIDRLVTEKWVELFNEPGNTADNVARLQGRVREADAAAQEPTKVRGTVRVQGTNDTKQAEGLWFFNPPSDAKPRVLTTNGDGVVGVWDATPGRALTTWLEPDTQELLWTTDFVVVESDLDFLKKATMAARGTAPTALEERYFTEDKDPKKREKLLDTLLKEPAVAKKLGDDFKKKMLAGQPNANVFNLESSKLKWLVIPEQQKPGGTFEYKVEPKQPGQNFEYKIEPAPKQGGAFRFEFPIDPKTGQLKPGGAPFMYEIQPTPPAVPKQPALPAVPKPPAPPQPPAAPQVDKLTKLVGELLAAKKTDAEMLEAVTLATVGRLPTDTEKKLTLSLVATVTDRKAAWVAVAKSLTGSNDSAKRVEVHLRTTETPEVELKIVPPVKP
jgi:RNA polymerase sigma factor (sigma-70 family)